MEGEEDASRIPSPNLHLTFRDLGDEVVVDERCQEAVKAREAKLVKAVAEQAAERRCLKALQCEVSEAQDAQAKQVSEANAKLTTWEEVIRAAADAMEAVDHVTLPTLGLRGRQALITVCRLEIESPFAPQDASCAQFSSELVKDLEGMSKKVDDILEEEFRDLFSMVATRFFIHLLLRDPRFEFEGVMGPMPEESCGALATAMEGHVSMLLGKFFYGDGMRPGEDPLFLS
ncbi:hypothetical protein D1007_31234 [Hordeum vulgare]|nr:hypothetical protein D1007_31234 [Hordeum vulgare]